ncbi:MAG: transketolase [Spirochaetia bacterium]|nr:transketolase [Spirochaetia bacterium]MCF7945301.1 transketolase [Spirochaetia bacterium]MCF7946584.1 transketolase [Spirochaetia bacterium]
MNSETYQFWGKIQDLIDNNIDLMLNYRQSGHPGGSRSKVPALISLLLGGAMRWDIRNPDKRFSDRFILGAGHTVPMIYATLAVFNEALRIKYNKTHDPKYSPGPEGKVLFWEDLVGFRRRGKLSGHAEMSEKTLFLKFNTGPSGHGTGAAAGQALALKRAGAENVKVFIMEGEGGLTPGATHEAANSAWGLALDNLYLIVDWNDYGIDAHKTSQIVFGGPKDWFSSHGWEVFNAGSGEDFNSLSHTFLTMTKNENLKRVPRVAWFTSRKGRGYLKYDNASHGAPHSMNSKIFWETKKNFMKTYGVSFPNYGMPAPETQESLEEEFRSNLKIVADVLAKDEPLIDYLADRLVELGNSVPNEISTCTISGETSPFNDDRLYDFRNYPSEIYKKPGESVPNRKALASWGSWINYFGYSQYNRPLFIASSADLSGSTNISGFAESYGDFPGYGWYNRVGTDQGVLLPQGITEFGNTALMTGMASVNFAMDPYKNYNGFWGATSTYGSFSYLVYGMLRLYSQMDQDSEMNLGKVIYVAGHSGPETADDSRTHFGIFSPGVTQLFPEGSIINLYPWEYNEVPVLLASALKLKKPSIIALHLTRPSIEVPDRDALGIASHFEASKGAYIVRDHHKDAEKEGTFYVQGTSSMNNLIQLFPYLNKKNYNVKIVYVSSPQLFALQNEEYRNNIITEYDRYHSTLITTSARKLMPEFTFNKQAEAFALTPDWDNRWRTGGTLEEVLEEAHLSPEEIKKGIDHFVSAMKRFNAQISPG